MTVREARIEMLKELCKSLSENADKVIPTLDGIGDINIHIYIPTQTDKVEFPEVNVSYDHVPVENVVAVLKKYYEIREE